MYHKEVKFLFQLLNKIPLVHILGFCGYWAEVVPVIHSPYFYHHSQSFTYVVISGIDVAS